VAVIRMSSLHAYPVLAPHGREEESMAYAAGSIVVLKSGGQLMTVVSASDDEIECVWLGEDGELFRHAIPAIALEAAPISDLEHDDDEEDEQDQEDQEEEDAEDDDTALEEGSPKQERAA